MASAWGKAWGSAWGNAWGILTGVTPVPAPPTAFGGGAVGGSRWYEEKEPHDTFGEALFAPYKAPARIKANAPVFPLSGVSSAYKRQLARSVAPSITPLDPAVVFKPELALEEAFPDEVLLLAFF